MLQPVAASLSVVEVAVNIEAPTIPCRAVTPSAKWYGAPLCLAQAVLQQQAPGSSYMVCPGRVQLYDACSPLHLVQTCPAG